MMVKEKFARNHKRERGNSGGSGNDRTKPKKTHWSVNERVPDRTVRTGVPRRSLTHDRRRKTPPRSCPRDTTLAR